MSCAWARWAPRCAAAASPRASSPRGWGPRTPRSWRRSCSRCVRCARGRELGVSCVRGGGWDDVCVRSSVSMPWCLARRSTPTRCGELACSLRRGGVQARQIVQSRAFGETLRACVKHCASHVAERIRSRIAALQGAATQGGAAAAGAGAAPDTVSLAHVVSNVLVEVPNELLAEQSSVGRELAKRQDVEALMLNAYARGPFLDDDDSD